MKKEYNAKSIQMLTDIESIRTSPGMYIGSTVNPNHLLTEVLDNSVDEALGSNCFNIMILINSKQKEISIIDDGRGIPIDDDIPVLISTKLFSGSKFKGSNKSYEISKGMHGVGLVAVNALSDYFNIEIYRDKKHAIFNFENTILKNKSISEFDKSPPFSTKITFKPSKKIFESDIIEVEDIISKLKLISVYLPKCKIILYLDNKKFEFKDNIHNFFKKEVLKNEESTNPIVISCSKGNSKLEIIFCYSKKSINSKSYSSVNLIPTEGGTHQILCYDTIRDYFGSKAKKEKRKFIPQDSLSGIRLFVSLMIEDPEYSGQTKQRLTLRKSRLQRLYSIFKTKVIKYFDDNPDYLKELLDKFDKYRKLQEVKKVSSKGNKLVISSTKLKDCTKRNGELFIVEGDSAAGSFVISRDVTKHAILPLKGKPPSIINLREKIVKNNEVAELIKTLGTSFGELFDITKLRYKKIIISADADSDGGHIVSLLIILFAVLLPELIIQNKLFVGLTPLFGITKNKKFIPLWEKKDLDEARKRNENITRFKGLGELSAWQLKICALDEKTRKIIPVKMTKSLEKMSLLFSSAEEKRKLLNNQFTI